jgi:hypothetical protein
METAEVTFLLETLYCVSINISKSRIIQAIKLTCFDVFRFHFSSEEVVLELKLRVKRQQIHFPGKTRLGCFLER